MRYAAREVHIERQVIVSDELRGIVMHAVKLSTGLVSLDLFDVYSKKEASIVLFPGKEPYVCGDLELAETTEEIRSYSSKQQKTSLP